MKSVFLIERQGVNTTFQDKGRFGFQHLGIPASGSMDNFLSQTANKLVGNDSDQAVIEFAYQGPLLKLNSGNAHASITGNVKFEIKKKNGKSFEGSSNSSFYLEEGDKLDVISTVKSIYGYLAVEGGFDLEKVSGSYSTLLKAKIGPNKGEKLSNRQEIFFYGQKNNKNKRIFFEKEEDEIIRVLEGQQADYFSKKSIDNFYSKEYKVTNLTDRMGARLEGSKLENIKSPNIKSEGISKGSIQVPGDGQPIVLLSDHPTIGGYPKIANIITADYDKLVQKIPGSNLKFKLVDLAVAESAFQDYIKKLNTF